MVHEHGKIHKYSMQDISKLSQVNEVVVPQKILGYTPSYVHFMVVFDLFFSHRLWRRPFF